jgi:hypothetical protein
LQQTPSTQLAFVHWLFVAHGAPSASFGTHIAAEQYWPGAQSPSTLHGPAHATAFESQPTGSQLCSCSGAHEPLPWQFAARSARLPAHLPTRHGVSAPG